ncbi:hypothetical protein CBR_g16908 [Chara braunii]|uniref:Uncharacterized protein n=1 Tax=Chara braunii TaxID=69332 RepID=A0A388KU24_CHABU|nr:hypothetical protein CBR_g16908 [Chara braunii]|eukprot:GBG73565.1 hypothetical protein CBR_g16908 [Chara braunii]
MLVESDNEPGVWFINSSQYRGWIFDDNLDIPRWVWVLRRAPTVKPDIYPPYDSRWRQMGAKRMVDRDVGFLTKPMIDDASVLDDRQRLQTMVELNKVGQAAKQAFLENRRAREEARRSKEKGSKDEEGGDSVQGSKTVSRSKGMTEQESVEDGGDRVTGSDEKGGESSTSLKRKITDRESGKAQDSGGESVEGQGKMAQDSDTDLEGDSDKGEDDWEEEDEEEEDEPKTLSQWIKHVHKLEWERHIECEIRLAHHKHLRNLKQATAAGDDITTTNRFERLKNEQEVNEFYTTQYGWKARLDRNDITVHNAGYSKQFIWPKSYQPQGLKRAEQKRRAQQQEQEQLGRRDHDLSHATQGLDLDEQMEEEKGQAAILEAQLEVLRDQNRELGEDTTNLQKIAYAPHADVNATAKLYARQNPGKRIILPYRWNSGNADWEVAIHRSPTLITVKDSHCEHVILKELITKDLPEQAHVIGDLNQDREEWEDTEGTRHMLD